MKKGDPKVIKADIDDEVVEHVIISAPVPAADTFKWLADTAYTVKHVTFHNYGGAGFTAAASVTNAGSTVVTSSALAADAVEEKEGADLSNTSVADGAALNLVAGDQTTFIVVVLTKKANT